MPADAQTKFSLKCKELMTEKLSDMFKTYSNFVVTNFFGISANDLNELRRDLGDISSKYFVIKNKIAYRVLDALKLTQNRELIKGGIGIGFIGGDVVEAAKKIVGFSKKHEPFKIEGAYVDGQRLNVESVKELASLPSPEILLSMIVTAMQMPISGFANVLGGILRKFVYAINAIKDRKQG